MTIITNKDRDFRLVLPKKGRLKDDFAAVMNPAGLRVEKADIRLDFGTMRDERGALPPFETLLQRPGDALQTLEGRAADMAVIGLDTYLEFNAAARALGRTPNLQIEKTLKPVSPCTLWIAGREEDGLDCPEDLQNLRVATAYPNLLRDWLDRRNIKGVDIIARDGGLEDTIRLGLADAICDVVQTGASLKANGLDAKFRVAESCAVIVTRNDDLTTRQAALGAAFMARVKQVLEPETIPAAARREYQPQPAFL